MNAPSRDYQAGHQPQAGWGIRGQGGAQHTIKHTKPHPEYLIPSCCPGLDILLHPAGSADQSAGGQGRRSLTHLDLSTRRTEKAPLSAALSSFIMAGLQRLPDLAELNLKGRPVAEHGGLWPLTCLAPTLTALTISGTPWFCHAPC